MPTPDPTSAVPPDGAAVACTGLGKTYTFHEQQPGLLGAVRSLVRRRIQERVAVSGLDLVIPEGEIVGLLGPNGAGKTTTIKMMCGLLRPTGGSVRVLGHEPVRRSFAFLRSISVVFGQKTMLWWDVPCYDSLLVHREMYDLTAAEFDASVAELGELLEVADILHVPVRKLSLGQRMRCELMLALLHRPRLLFADEPTIGLDVVAKAAVRDFFAKVNRELGTTVVLTSHDMDDVEALCRRVVLVNHGRKVFDGELADLARSVRPGKQVVVSYAEAVRPPSGAELPAGTTLADEASERSLRFDVERAHLPALLGWVTGLGTVTDLQVTDADLDQVMADVFRGDGL